MQVQSLSQIFQQSAADGKMSKSEVKQIKAALEASNLPPEEQAAILRLADKIKDFTKGGLFREGVLNPDEISQLKAMEPELQNSEFAREMLSLFEDHVQEEKKPFSVFQAIGDFFRNLFGGSNSTESTTSTPTPDLASQNETQSYPSSGYEPQGVNFPEPQNRANNPVYPTLPQADPVASLPDYTPEYFKNSNPGEMYQRSPHHDDNKFVPAFAMTAFHESGVYRDANDPYAVGAISKPSRRQDLGGKTYGAYQFESSVYTDGSTSGRARAAGSTLMRFINAPNNPFGAELRAAAQQHGIASPGFDAVWKNLAQTQNKAFGEAQEQFMLQERGQQVEQFMDKANLSPEVRQDSRIIDLIMGTTNQVASLSNGVADYLAQKQASLGRQMSVEEVGIAITDYKKEHIGSWFRSSPEAHAGIRNRYNEEQDVFTG